ncbi:hypothetical protein SC1083_0124 [Aggregatibacter actinomycetemcomitans serotype e str. SC1083]|uniref:Uncharacterized protein n=1 Tax=Aggregatibacter actinomycetemcomitans serotype e str. SC1083 TaxID=907488 RepID=G4A5N9_AGGAC|nr:hypothetical protein SC1083_0124 [Aggregatibacter actinomycetemcomitans serotype e str. SC1083]KYK74069.1 hypothetical protein SA3096_06115 [Aggregatibacter actinomycetemcomitans serotype e str. SA3096]KYK79623.1 hypothetical protein SC936_07690 [Aggregatibacter actinomycetemcomitans serotype e str. SC936]KYK96706.1 hypothetical protein ANH9776_00590 [Aggregatibacter actinomycetemcomitans serotype e str. ANH9776]
MRIPKSAVILANVFDESNFTQVYGVLPPEKGRQRARISFILMRQQQEEKCLYRILI